MKLRKYRTPPKNEAALEVRVRDWCKDAAWKRKKMSSPGSRGTLDDLIMKGGRSVWIELKMPGNTPTELQWLEIADLRAHGIEAYWCDTLEQVIGILMKSEGWHEALPLQEEWLL